MTLSQAELTELYLDALLKNPDAMPPLQLNAETANLVRSMVIHRRRDLPSMDVQDRVWRQILFGLHATPEENPAASILVEEESAALIDGFMAITLPGKVKRPEDAWRSKRFRSYAHFHRAGVLVAAIFTLLFFSGLLLRSVNELPGDLQTAPAIIQNTYGSEFDPGARLLPGDGRDVLLNISFNSREDISGVLYATSAFHELTP